jgi:hypothetical protein
MTIHLSKFIERVQGQQARGARDFIMSLKMHKTYTPTLPDCC